MLVRAVAGVDNGDARKLRRHTRRAVFGVALDDGISISGNDAGGIGKRLAFFRTGIRAVRETDNFAAQPLYRRFKRQARTRGRFKEARTDKFPFQQVAVRLRLQFQCRLKQQLELFPRQIRNRNNMLFI